MGGPGGASAWCTGGLGADDDPLEDPEESGPDGAIESGAPTPRLDGAGEEDSIEAGGGSICKESGDMSQSDLAKRRAVDL